jgi:hypothetical protein
MIQWSVSSLYLDMIYRYDQSISWLHTIDRCYVLV